MYINLTLHLFIHIYIHTTLHLSNYMYIHSIHHLSNYMYIHPNLYLSNYMYININLHLFIKGALCRSSHGSNYESVSLLRSVSYNQSDEEGIVTDSIHQSSYGENSGRKNSCSSSSSSWRGRIVMRRKCSSVPTIHLNRMVKDV